MSKKILVTGSSGFVANYVMQRMALLYPKVTIIGMSRSGKIRCPELVDKFP